MNIHSYNILNSHISLTNILINFFTAESSNPILFKSIQEICIRQSNHYNIQNAKTWINLGYLSLNDFTNYISETQINNGQYETQIADHVVRKLVEHHIVIPLSDIVEKTSLDKRYKCNGEYTKFLCERDLILNVICGWKFIIDKYSGSILKIENKNSNGDYSIGTGFYCSLLNDKIDKHIVITNKHVLEKASSIRLLTKEDNEIKYTSIKKDLNRDLAFIELEESLDVPCFCFNSSCDVLSEIITIGYPSIPMTKYAYQLCHKGEINTLVEDYMGNKLFLFSAKTSSGNSGSPIIDSYGMIVGIVSEELFEKEQFFEKGKLPYYAGIPSEEIVKSINEYILI